MTKEGYVVYFIYGTGHDELRLGQANRLEPLTLHFPNDIMAVLLDHLYAGHHDILVLSPSWGLSMNQGHQMLLLVVHNYRGIDILGY